MPPELPETPDDDATPEPSDAVRRAALRETRRVERRALGFCTVLALATIIYITRPFGVGILLGLLLAFSSQQYYDRVAQRTRRPALTALAFVLVSAAGLLGVLTGIFSLLITRGAVLAEGVITELSPGGELRDLAERTSARLGPFQFKSDEVTAKLRDAAAELATQAAGMARDIASATMDGLLTLFFALMTLSFILVRWKSLAARAEILLPLRPRYTRTLLEELQRAGRNTLLGTVITGLAQGALAAIGYWITGVPEPAFFGAVTAVASLVPAVGTLLVWVPVGAVLLATGHLAAGVVELCWGGLMVVGVPDYVLRPRLVGGHGGMPSLATFVALFGGVEVFGLAGLVVGPLLMSISISVLRIYAADADERPAEP